MNDKEDAACLIRMAVILLLLIVFGWIAYELLKPGDSIDCVGLLCWGIGGN
jgi:hypothetical protein